MNDATKVQISMLALRTMRPEQLQALQENVIGTGQWETADEVQIMSDFGTIMALPQEGCSHDDADRHRGGRLHTHLTR